MANPQAEDGHVDIANEIVEVLAKTQLSGYESRVLWIVFRKTYGWHKKEDWITNTQIANMTGIAESHISRTIKILIQRKIVTKIGKKISFQKDYDKWEKLPKLVSGGDWRNEDNWESNPIKNIRRKIFRRDNKKCVLCGNKKNLCIHHIDYNEENWEEKNLITLCNSCHPKTNSKNQKQWITFFNDILVTKNGKKEEVTNLGEEVTNLGEENTKIGKKSIPKLVDTKETKETLTKETIQKVQNQPFKSLNKEKKPANNIEFDFELWSWHGIDQDIKDRWAKIFPHIEVEIELNKIREFFKKHLGHEQVIKDKFNDNYAIYIFDWFARAEKYAKENKEDKS